MIFNKIILERRKNYAKTFGNNGMVDETETPTEMYRDDTG